MPESSYRNEFGLKAWTGRLNVDHNTLMAILPFVFVSSRPIFGNLADLFCDSPGDWATKKTQEKTIEPISDRFIHFYKFPICQPKNVSDGKRRIRNVRNGPFFEIALRSSRKHRVSRY